MKLSNIISLSSSIFGIQEHGFSFGSYGFIGISMNSSSRFVILGFKSLLGSLRLFIGIKYHWDERDDEKSFKAKVRTFTLIKFLSLSFLWDITPLGLSSYWDFGIIGIKYFGMTFLHCNFKYIVGM